MNMRFLKKIGDGILKGVFMYMGFAPTARQAFPDASGKIQIVEDKLAQIADVIISVESMGQVLALAGDQKLKASAPLVAQVILKSALMANHKIDDAAMFNQGVMKMADGMADILNSLEEK